MDRALMKTLKAGRDRRRKIGPVLCALSILVAAGVFWVLRTTGLTMNGDACCGKAEHIHSEMCTERRLVCGYDAGNPGDGHIHTEDCYETVYICGIEEHAHSLSCYSDPTADVEAEEDWVLTLPEQLSGRKVEALTAAARSQLGYRESERNYVVAEDGKTIRGYTRYGQWYGNPYGDWNAMFAAFCLHYAGIGEDILPYNSGCFAWTAALEQKGLLLRPNGYEPAEGDLVFFDRDGDGEADRVAIVVEAEKTSMTLIEGDRDNAAAEYRCAPDDSAVYAYVSVAQRLGEVLSARRTLLAEVYRDAQYTAVIDGSAEITVTGILPEGAYARAYPVHAALSDRNVLWAYDITVFERDGTPWQPQDGRLTVAVRHGESTISGNEDMGLLIFYVPEEGEAQRVPSRLDENGISFDADHFSVYAAVEAGGTEVTNEAELREAFASGAPEIRLTADLAVTGPVTLDGGSYILDLNGHILTVQGPDALFDIGGGQLTIIDSGAAGSGAPFTYTVTESVITDAATGATVETKAAHSIPLAGRIVGGSGPIAAVSGGTLTLESGTLCNGSGRAVRMTGGTVELTGGLIYGFVKTGNTDFGGAVWMNGGTLNISGTVLAANSAPNGGAVYAEGGSIHISGGVISGNTATRNVAGYEGAVHNGGGGLYCGGNTAVEMSGGYLTNNKVNAEVYFDGGGGAMLTGSARFTLTGGYITGNEASGGGGLRTDFQSQASFVMRGGVVSGNTARSTEGGGIAIDRGGSGEILGGHITNNVTNTKEHWGGGGVFCADGAYLRVYHVIVTENAAGGFGGGVAGCSTGRVYICVKNGGAIYDNTAAGTNLSGSGSQKNDDHTYAASSPVFMENGYQDYFCALNSLVEGGMLGGGSANWSGSMDGAAISNVPRDVTLEAAYVMGLTSAPSAADIARAQSEARVFINGNSSYTHGGGILCNGYLLVGDKNPIAVGSRLTLSGTKQLTGALLKDYVFTFHVTDEDGNVVSVGASDASGNIRFDRLLSFTEELCAERIPAAGGSAAFTYYLTEQQDPRYPEISIDRTQYRITVTVTREDETLPFEDADGFPIKKSHYKIQSVTVEKRVKADAAWSAVAFTYKPSADEQHGSSLQITNGTTFTNKLVETTEFTVIKKWVGGDYPGPITVDLLQNGAVYDTVVLDPASGWSHTWEKLPVGFSYTVYEHPVPGYDTVYVDSTVTDGGGSAWVPADSLVAGEQYMIVSPDGTQALFITAGHQNNGFDFSDKIPVEQKNGTLELGGRLYTAWYEAGSIPDRSIFTAQNASKNGNPGIVLKNNGASKDTWLLVQNANNNHLKSTSGLAYASFFTVEGGVLKGQENYNWNPGDLRSVIYADEKFNTNTGSAGAARLYTLVTVGETARPGVTIVNTRREETYDLHLTKVDAGDGTTTLADAVFRLLQNGEILTFRWENGQYIFDKDGTVTDLVTDENGVLRVTGLPEGRFVLRETEAPSGYAAAEDRTLTFPDDAEDGRNLLQIVVEDEKLAYSLPQTGGTGLLPFYLGGGLLMAISAACACGRKRRKNA